MLTCKQFLQELTDYLDDSLDPAFKAELQRHVDECPNCWVVCDTTSKTLRVFKGMEPQPVPEAIQSRLMEAIQNKCAARREAKKHASGDGEVPTNALPSG